MVYTRTTPDNTAVASLVAGGSCRVRSHGEAPLKITAGSYLIRIAVGERTDSASALLTIYDSEDVDNAVGVRLLTGSAGITDDGQDITATALDAWSSDGNQEYAFEVALPEPTGEWVLSLRTDESSAAVPMDFSGFHVEDTLQRGTAQVGPGDIAVNALGRCRYAAFSGLGAGSTAGAFASVTWAPTAGLSFQFRGVAASAVAPGGQLYLMGRPTSGYAAISIETNGAIAITNGTTPIASSAAGVVSFNGLPFEWQADITNTSAVLRVNGAVVASSTFAAVGWSTVAGANGIGAFGTGTHRRWPGSIQLVELIDNVTASNTRRFLMDEPSGNYADSSGNGGTAASRNGFVSVCPVLSLDGLGRPWQRAPALVTCARTTAAQTGITAAANITLGAELLDPLNAFTSSAMTIPAAGVVVCSLVGTMAETAAATSTVTIGVAVSTTIQGVGAAVQVPASTTGVPFAVSVAFAVAANSVVRGRISGIAGGGTISIESATLTIQYFPDSATG